MRNSCNTSLSDKAHLEGRLPLKTWHGVKDRPSMSVT
jgi:hypothetical protein